MEVGFIGLGIMGKPMCKNLLSQNIEVYISSSRSSTNDELKKLGASVADSYEDVAEHSDILILMLSNSQDVHDAVFGNGLYKKLKEGSIVADIISIPSKMRE